MGITSLARRLCRFRFGLRTMLLLVTAVGMMLGWQTHVVHQRRAAKRVIEARGGFVDEWETYHPGILCGVHLAHLSDPPRLPWLRRWLGDEPIESVFVKRTADVAWAQGIFPEAEVESLEEYE